jgi:hypothetical protein
MNSPNPKDLLSAFYDREVAPEEEVAAQAQVQRSPEAGREIKDYARLSRLLQQLPQLKAPPEFAAAVMRRAERESLIPLDAGTAQPAAAPPPAVDWRRRWILAGVSVATVAGIGLVVTFWGLPKPREFHAGPVAVALPERVPNDNPRKLAVGFDAAKRRDTAALARREVPADRLMTNAPRAAAMPSPALPQSQAATALMLPANLKTAKVGDVVEALQQDGQQVAVVRLTVVNQVEGLDGVQSVLVRNTSRTLQNADEIKRLRQQFGADKSGDMPKSTVAGGPGDLICVYMEGSRDEMVGVLHDLQKESHIQAAELTNTISIKALEQYANHAVSGQKQAGERVAADGQTPAATAARIPAKPSGSQLAVSLPAATVDKILSANHVPAAVAGRQNSRSEASSEQVVQQSPAAPAPLSPTASLDKSESTREKEATGGRTRAGQSATVARRAARAGSRSADKQSGRSDLWEKDEIASSGKSFQIFFVITDQVPAPVTPPAPATAKSAAKPAPPAPPPPVWSSPKKRAQ